MDKDTFHASLGLIMGVADMTGDYLFEGNPSGRADVDMFEAIDDAIQELESWKKEINERIINKPS